MIYNWEYTLFSDKPLSMEKTLSSAYNCPKRLCNTQDLIIVLTSQFWAPKTGHARVGPNKSSRISWSKAVCVLYFSWGAPGFIMDWEFSRWKVQRHPSRDMFECQNWSWSIVHPPSKSLMAKLPTNGSTNQSIHRLGKGFTNQNNQMSTCCTEMTVS